MRVILLVLLCTFSYINAGGYAGVGGGGGYGAVGPYGGVAGPGGFSNAPDFNPILLQGSRGYPGLKARINQRAFQYASGLIGEVLNQEIKKARIPPISQCIPQVQGCIQVYNLYVSRYRCPQRVVVYPAPPNRVILQVQNVDIGVTGNLGGQIVILLPIALFGIVQVNIHQVTITVELGIERGVSGPYVRLLNCNMQIGYLDAYIENGGLVGQIANSQFRSQISNQIRQMVPGQVCGQLPSIINEKINSKLSALPQSIAVTQMLSLFGGALGLGGGGCSSSCGAGSQPSAPTPNVLPSLSPAPVFTNHAQPTIVGGAAPAPQIPTGAYIQGKKYVVRARGLATDFHKQEVVPRGLTPIVQPHLRQYRAIQHHPAAFPHHTLYVPTARAKRAAVAQRLYLTNATRPAVHGVPQYGQGPYGVVGGVSGGPPSFQAGAGPRYPPPPPISAGPPPHAQQPQPVELCNKCPSSQEDPASFLRQIAAHLDMSKLNDLYLSVQLLNTYATSNDFTIDLSGEFSPNAQGGTPFGPFPVQFPGAYDNHMLEFIVTDYTVNSLFYQLHRKQFLSFRIGPDTPKIGELLKTTCSDDSDDLEATDVELDEEEARRRRRLANLSAKSRTKRAVVVPPRPRHAMSAAPTIIIDRSNDTITSKKKRDSRRRRQEDTAGLADLGICFGDILPAIREKYPNQKIAIQLHTTRAPSVLLSAARGGMAILDLIVDADIFIDGTNNRVGTITIAATVQVVVQINGNRLTGSAEITQLQLSDRTQSLGLPQDALDNLGNLGKELLQKVANDALQKGISFNLPQNLPIPVQIINPAVRIIEHGLYIATDITVSPSLLGIGGGGGCCGTGC